MRRAVASLFCAVSLLFAVGCSASPPETQHPAALKAEKASMLQDSGKGRELSQDEVKAIVDDLLPRGEKAVELIYGMAVQAKIPQSAPETDGADFFPVTGPSRSLSEIKKEVEAVFTPQVAGEYYRECLSGDDPVFRETDGVLQYNRNHRKYAALPEWQADTAILMRQTVDEITVEMDVVSQGSEPVRQNLKLKKTGDRWYLDSELILS